MSKKSTAPASRAKDQFSFRRLDMIGLADAEDDEEYLQQCFVDTGYLETMRNLEDPRTLLLGRTGSGKTALIKRLQDVEERTIVIPPETLALTHIANSTILAFFLQLGIDLDIFFRLLWKHVFVVEIIRAHLGHFTDEARAGWIEKFRAMFRDKKDKEALEYLERWGKSFWEETDYRIKEFTQTLESDLKASLGTGSPGIPLTVDAARRLTEEQKGEILYRAQHVVNQVQVDRLTYIMRKLDSILDDQQKRYFIVIDRLDEDWVEDKLRFLLIRALIETSREFRKVRHAKILIAIRLDLLERVIRATRDTGFQEEKYESLYLNIQWTPAQLTQVLDNRVNYLVRQRYTKKAVTVVDVLPRTVDKQKPLDYMLARTMMRPRDIIMFFNKCIAQAANTAQVTATMLKTAEGDYSRSRMRSLADEWSGDYPNFFRFVEFLKGRPSEFGIGTISATEIEELCLNLVCDGFDVEDDFSRGARQVVDCALSASEFLRIYFKNLYRTGLVGLKLAPHEGTVWSIDGSRTVSLAEIVPTSRVSIHPCAWRTLGTEPPASRRRK